MLNNKGSILIECVISLAIISICTSLILSVAQMLTNKYEFNEQDNMYGYWNRITRKLIYCYQEDKIVDIAY